MPPLPVVSGKQVRAAFESLGWRHVRQSGSHMILVREGHPATLSVPKHAAVAKGTLRSLIRSSGLTVEEFLAALS